MRRIVRLSCVFVMALGLLAGCGDDHDHGHGHDHDGEHGHDHDGEHEHGEGAHHGVMAHLEGDAGHLELKLHDDKGDLELWLTEDEKGTAPIDLPLDAKISVTFVDMDDKVVTLAVRNTEKNEDEDGLPNIRDGKTNYFIFPGDTGADASWLQGKTFRAKVVVSFEHEGKTVKSEAFELAPHTH